MRILVTGGAGYIGNILIPELCENGYSVRVFDSLLFGNKSDWGKKVEFIQGDMNDTNILEKALNGINGVIHLAAIVGDIACDLNKELATKTNFLATKHLAELCAKRNIKLIFSSTCSVYGSQPDALITEESPVAPLTIYALSKLAAEEAILKLSNDSFRPTIFRLGTAHGYSSRMRFDLVVNMFVAKAIQEKRISVFYGSQWRPLLHIKDIPPFCILALESDKGGIYNLSGKNYRIIDLANIISSTIPCEVEVLEEMVDKRNYRVSSEKVRQTFGMSPDRGVEDTVKEIKTAFQKGLIKNYKDETYYNDRSLLKKQ